jgi:hypothetical protein
MIPVHFLVSRRQYKYSICFFLAKDAWTVVKNNFGIHTTPLVLNTSWETGFKKFSTGYRELVLSPSTAAGRPEDTT